MPQLSDGQRSFHLAEFQKLTGELADMVKAGAATFRYAVFGSAALFAWLLTSEDASCLRGDARLYHIALWIPLVVTGSLSIFAFANGARFQTIAEYLSKLEQMLGHHELGWEKYLKKERRILLGAGYVAWIALLAGDLLAPLLR